MPSRGAGQGTRVQEAQPALRQPLPSPDLKRILQKGSVVPPGRGASCPLWEAGSPSGHAAALRLCPGLPDSQQDTGTEPGPAREGSVGRAVAQAGPGQSCSSGAEPGQALGAGCSGAARKPAAGVGGPRSWRHAPASRGCAGTATLQSRSRGQDGLTVHPGETWRAGGPTTFSRCISLLNLQAPISNEVSHEGL